MTEKAIDNNLPDFPHVDPTRTYQQFSKAIKDITDGIKLWRVWTLLAWLDIKLRYRRTSLGPIWVTLSIGIRIYTMGFLYGYLFHVDLANYYPYLAISMLVWSFITTGINNSCDSFIQAGSYLTDSPMPYSLFMFKTQLSNLLIFLHQIMILVPIALMFFHCFNHSFSLLLVFPGMLLIFLNTVCYGFFFAAISIRYRDISQIIESITSVAFFMTPVIWSADNLPQQYQYLVSFNPFYCFISLVRCPLLGQHMSLVEYGVVAFTTLFGVLLALTVLTKYRSRIIYWL